MIEDISAGFVRVIYVSATPALFSGIISFGLMHEVCSDRVVQGTRHLGVPSIAKMRLCSPHVSHLDHFSYFLE